MTKTPRLKVYGWTSFRSEAIRKGSHDSQTREIVAAKSAAEVMRITGMSRTDWKNSGCETGNEHEIQTALAEPGVVFWQPIYSRPEGEWKPATST
jgi:hypothetical protein